jgi:chromosome segregation ATPase
VLVLTGIGIGIGIWSALAASSAGVDDETMTLIESLKVNSEQSVVSMSENTKSVELAEKKLDAINFQLEQLVTDLASSTKVAAPKSEVLDPLGLGREGVIDKSLEAVTHSTAAVPAKADPAVLSKITSVNSKMIRAQRRIDEVNSRVKSIQKQYQVLLKSVKMVEKQIVMEQLAKAEKAEKEKVAKDANPYQYTAPDGMFYDQSVQDSYP